MRASISLRSASCSVAINLLLLGHRLSLVHFLIDRLMKITLRLPVRIGVHELLFRIPKGRFRDSGFVQPIGRRKHVGGQAIWEWSGIDDRAMGNTGNLLAVRMLQRGLLARAPPFPPVHALENLEGHGGVLEWVQDVDWKRLVVFVHFIPPIFSPYRSSAMAATMMAMPTMPMTHRSASIRPPIASASIRPNQPSLDDINRIPQERLFLHQRHDENGEMHREEERSPHADVSFHRDR